MHSFFFFFGSFENFYFIHKELVLFPPKEVRLVQLNEADVPRILAETLAAHFEAVFPDQTVPGLSRPGKSENLAEFSRMAPLELLVTHVAFSAATR